MSETPELSDQDIDEGEFLDFGDDLPAFSSCDCALSEEENSCISRKIRKLLAEGKDRDQAIAIAVSMCKGEEAAAAYETAKEKKRSKWIEPDGQFKKVDGSRFKGCVAYQMKSQGLDKESAEKLCAYIGRRAGKIAQAVDVQFDDKPSLPGGEYESIQNSDGSWNILDVPIFAEHDVRTGDGQIHIGRKWMLQALEVAQIREREDRYLPPLHIHHHGTGRDTQLAGFFRLKEVRRSTYQGRPIWTTFADLVAVPEKVYEEIKRGRLPYRSVEIHRVSLPSIDSLAIMPDSVPFFRLPMLTVGEENPVGSAKKLQAVAAPALAYRASGTGYALLSTLGGQEMATDTSRAEVVLGSWEEDEKEDSKIEINVEEKEEINESLRSKISTSLREILSLMEEEIEEEEEEEEVKEQAPAPIDMASNHPVKASSSSADVQMMARLDAAERDLRQIKTEREIETRVGAIFADLEKRGLADDPIRERLTSIAQADGLPAMKAYADALREFPVDPPSRWTGDFRNATNDAEIAKYAEHGPEASEKANRYAKEYDQLQERGLGLTLTRAEYIEGYLADDGFASVSKSNGRM